MQEGISSGQGVLALSAVKVHCRGHRGSTYLSLSTVVSWKEVNQHWFPIGICQLCRLQSCGEGGKNSLGDLFAVSMNRCSSSTTDFSLFWSLSSKGKVLPKVGFHRPPPGPAMDVLVLLLKCGELCTSFKRILTHLLQVKRNPLCTSSLTHDIQNVILRHVQSVTAKMFSI